MALVTSSLENDVLELVFNDPKSRNSLSLAAATEIEIALETAMKTKQKFGVVIFNAPGRVFCSGGQLDDYAGMKDASEGIAVNDRIRAILDHLSRLQVPTICVVTGDCFGGGIELVSAFDFVLATPNVLLGFWQRKIGLSFGWGGGQRLLKRVSAAKLKAFTLSTRLIGASEAQAEGLIDEVVHAAKIRQRSLALAKELMKAPKAAAAALKNFSPEKEVETFNTLWWNEEHRAVLNSRPAKPIKKS
ncbi:MAG: enoyl-CoA hydratase/isomerase family protein [Bdellovibrionota bacterium]